MNKKRLIAMLAILAILVPAFAPAGRVSYAATRTFDETGKTVSDTFLDYWEQHGGLAQQGFPISEEMDEVSDTDGQTYTVQYFERAVFEKHPENAEPYDVLLSLLGTTLYNNKYKGNAPGQTASTTNARTFSETGKTLGGVFRKYWEQHGGLAQQGYPISNEFKEKSDTDGKTYTVQYFERAVFEYHPENAGKPSEVLLSLLGQFRLSGNTGTGTGTGGTTPPAPPSAQAKLNVPGWTHITVTTNKIALFYNAATGTAITARVEMNAPNVGSLTILQKYPDNSKDLNGLDEGWTTVEAAPNNQVLLYSSESGFFEVLKVDDDGLITLAARFKSVTGFSKIMIDPLSGIMFYQNKDDNTVAMDKLFEDGTFINIIKTGPAKNVGTDVVVTPMVVAGLWYTYLPSNGLVVPYVINDRAEFVQAAQPGVMGKNVTQIASDYNNHAVFYSKSEKLFTISNFRSQTGQFGQVQISNATQSEKSWSIVAGTQSVILICYDDKGNIQTNYVAENGAVVPLKSFDAGK